MPTYEYRCKNCDHQFDIVQSFSDNALTECPSCHEATLKKVFGNVGISFKGSGFYKTDSRSNSSSAGGGGDKSSNAASDSSSTGSEKAPSSSSESSGSGSDKSSSGSDKKAGAASSSGSSSSSDS